MRQILVSHLFCYLLHNHGNMTQKQYLCNKKKKTKLIVTMLRKAIALILLSFVLMVNAQTGKLYDGDHQLSSSFTTKVFLDRDGFVWVLTRDGINRYDGYKFHILKKVQLRKRVVGLPFRGQVLILRHIWVLFQKFIFKQS